MSSATQTDLAELQAEALRVGRESVLRMPPARSSIEAVLRLPAVQGFPVLGFGSSRVALDLNGGAVAKIAYSIAGLALNLQEMAVWTSFPDDRRQHLTPCHDLSSELVLAQERVEVFGFPAVKAEDLEDRNFKDWATCTELAGPIYACREALGLWSDPDPFTLRVDNFGTLEGRVVAVDYGDQFAPLPDVWAQLLGEPDPTMGFLLERAGLALEDAEDPGHLQLLQSLQPVPVEDFLTNLMDR